MPSRQYELSELRVAGTAFPLRSGQLHVTRDDPMPGVAGLTSWTISAITDPIWMEPDDHPVEAVSTDGQRFSGRAILTNTNGTAHRFQGNGPLDGFDRSEL